MRQKYIVDYNKALIEKESLDTFLQNKINFLEEVYDADITKQNFWRCFNNYIHEFEEMYDKDLAMFNESDVQSVIKAVMTTSTSFLYLLKSVINSYEEWALKTGLNPTYNPCNGWDLKDIIIVNVSDIKDNYISIEELFELWGKVQDNEIIDYQEFATVLLARLGLKGSKWSELKYLKIEDIDFDNYVINVTDRNEDNINSVNVIKKIDIDKGILDVLIQANNQTGNVRKKFDKIRTKEFLNREFILKSTESEIINDTLIRANIVSFFKNTNSKYIPAKNLFRNAEVDELLRIKEDKKWKKLDMDDFTQVVQEFDLKDSYNVALKLKEYYTFITGDDDFLNLNGVYDKDGNRIYKRRRKK